MENYDDLEVDDLASSLTKKKKIKSGSKGKRGERDLVHDLNTRFLDLLSANPDWGQFSRSVGSGNRWGQNVFLPKHAKDTFSGDLTCPPNFRFVIESKAGYNDIDLYNCLNGKCKELDQFLEQVTDDSNRSGRLPLLIWKKDRKDKLCFLRNADLNPSEYIVYKGWKGMSFSWLLSSQSDNFFFDLSNETEKSI